MKRNRFMLIFGFCVVFFIMSFYLGYQLMDMAIDDKHIVEEEKHIGNEDIEIVREENMVSPNTFIEERIHYKECGHLVNKVQLAEEEVVNLRRDEYEEYLNTTYSNLRLISFSNVKVVLYGERNHLCQEHYIVGENNGYIAIFNIDENGDKILFKSFTDYPLSILLEMDQVKLREGIVVDSEEELSEIMENFIS